MTSLIMRAHLRQALCPATLYRGPNTRRTLLTLKETLVCPVSSHSDSSHVSSPIYVYSTRSPPRLQAGATAPFLRRPQMARRLSPSNSQPQRRSEVVAMRGTTRSNSSRRDTRRVSWARSKPSRRNRARKRSASRLWCTPMCHWDGPQIALDSA